MIDYKDPWIAEGVAGLTSRCPDDNEIMSATGRVYFDPNLQSWFAEYRCPRGHDPIVKRDNRHRAIVEAAPKRRP